MPIICKKYKQAVEQSGSNRIQKLELGFQENISKLETQLILLVDIPKKLDGLIEMLNKYMIDYSRESEKRIRDEKEFDRINDIIKNDVVKQSDLKSFVADGKYKMLWGGLIGVVVTFIVLGIIGSIFPNF